MIYQTARVDRVTWHVGRIRAWCKETSTCTPAELRRITAILSQVTVSLSQRYSQLHQHELGKGYPDRFPNNSDSIGIELVGNYNPTTSAFEAVATAQQTSLTWLITELTKLLGITLTDIYRHPEISYKDPGDLSGTGPAITEIRVDGPASGPRECNDFRLDETDIRFFWENAIVIAPQEWQQTYDVLPCDLGGSFVKDGEVYSWRINTGGSGRLTSPDGNVRLYGCEVCRGRY